MNKKNTNVYVFWNWLNYITPNGEDILFGPYDDVNYSDETSNSEFKWIQKI